MQIKQSHLYGLTIFLASFLLFLVQPLITKFLLPLFGGGPMVWVTALVFFQSALFIGYLYAHLLGYLPMLYQKWIHLCLTALALFSLPLAISPEFILDPSKPFSQLSILLLLSIGLPYVLLASTSPLLQYWLAQKKGENPYKLYAVSNIASIGALLAYPFFFEPMLKLSTQSSIWSITFVLFFLTLVLISLDLPNKKKAEKKHSSARPSIWHYLQWILYPAIASILLLAISNQISLDIAPTPLIWILPLLVYLFTFILTFHDDFWYKRPLFFLLFIATLIAYLGLAVSGGDLILIVAANLLLLFTGGMICHGELVRLKPKTDWLTSFYLSLSAGGALGGIFAGLVAPKIFTIFWELPIALISIGVIIALTVLLNKKERAFFWTKKWQTVGCSILLIGLLMAISVDTYDYTDGATHIRRNFYGILKVSDDLYEEEYNQRELLHGSTLHGTQYLEGEFASFATTYYGSGTPIGQIMELASLPDSFHLGVIGLGTGTLATYGDTNDMISFYEIDPDIIDIANEYFTYLNSFDGVLKIHEGDARITLQDQESQSFDVLVVDAFSSDAIPTHLLTKEATEVYLSHLNENGIIAFHISNRHLDLEPVIGALADEFGLYGAFMESLEDRPDYVFDSSWVVLSRMPLSSELQTEEIRYSTSLWTDDYSNLLSIIY